MGNVPSNPEELASRVEDLFTLPDIYVKVKELIDDPEASIGDIGNVVALDPGISARLLKFSNSAFFGQSRTVETVGRAVNILGTQTVHDVILATSVANAFSGIDDSVMDMAKFWSGSIYRGVVARLLAIECGLLDSERVFVQGLLSDIGHLVMYKEIPELAAAAATQATESGAGLAAVERELIGYDYAGVGGALMCAWELPESITETVRHHTDLSQSTSFPLESAIVHLACHIAVAAESDVDVSEWDLPVDPLAWQTTKLEQSIYSSIEEAADAAVGEARELFQ